MSSIHDIRFQYYPGNIRKAHSIGEVSMAQFIGAHLNPKPEVVQQIQRIAQAKKQGDTDLVAKLKHRLYYFTPGAIFDGRRKYENIVRFTGLAQIDIDKLDDSVNVEDLKREIFDLYPELFCVYTSPSRKGVKGLMRIDIAKDINDFKKMYWAIEQEFKSWLPEFDPAPKNLALPLFLSYDRKMLWRDDPNVWFLRDDLPDVDAYTNLANIENFTPTKTEGDETVYKSDAYYRKITLDIYKKKIESITDNGHPQLRTASLILGSRVGAGYVSQSEAEQYAEFIIRGTPYLKKDLSGYIKTMRWAINQGNKNPKYYE